MWAGVARRSSARQCSDRATQRATLDVWLLVKSTSDGRTDGRTGRRRGGGPPWRHADSPAAPPRRRRRPTATGHAGRRARDTRSDHMVIETARRVYATLGRPSVCLSRLSTAAAACGGFAAGRLAGIQFTSSRRTRHGQDSFAGVKVGRH